MISLTALKATDLKVLRQYAREAGLLSTGSRAQLLKRFSSLVETKEAVPEPPVAKKPQKSERSYIRNEKLTNRPKKTRNEPVPAIVQQSRKSTATGFKEEKRGGGVEWKEAQTETEMHDVQHGHHSPHRETKETKRTVEEEEEEEGEEEEEQGEADDNDKEEDGEEEEEEADTGAESDTEEKEGKTDLNALIMAFSEKPRSVKKLPHSSTPAVLRERIDELQELCQEQRQQISALLRGVKQGRVYENLYYQMRPSLQKSRLKTKKLQKLNTALTTQLEEHGSTTLKWKQAVRGKERLATQLAQLRENEQRMRQQHEERLQEQKIAHQQSMERQVRLIAASEERLNRQIEQLQRAQLESKRLDPTTVNDALLKGMDAVEVQSLADLYSQAARVCQNAVVVKLREEKEKAVHALESKEAKLRELGTCKICLELAVTVIFIPCGHMSCCRQCADKCASCPICRVNVNTRHTVYVS